MIKVYIFGEFEIYNEQAESMSELKRIILDNYNDDEFRFGLDDTGSDAKSFRSFFKGVKL